MTVQRIPQHKNSTTRPVKEAIVAIKKVQTKKKDIPQTKPKERAKPKSKKTLAETQKSLRAAQAAVKRERQARIKAETALAQAQGISVVEQLEVEQERRARLRRVSFIVRLTLDKHSQFVRTEIEHVSSSRRQNFLSFDGERLVAFMKACISTIVIPEDTIPTVPPPIRIMAPTAELLRPKPSLFVSDVQVFRPEHPNFVALTLTPEEHLVVQAHFQLQGQDSYSLTTQKPSYKMKIYANEVTSGKSRLLTGYSAVLIPNVLEYTAPVELPGLPSGLYRLFTVVILDPPIKMAGFYGKTIIHVI